MRDLPAPRPRIIQFLYFILHIHFIWLHDKCSNRLLRMRLTNKQDNCVLKHDTCSLMLQRKQLPQSMFRRPVNFHQTTRRHMPKDCYIHSYICKNLKSFKTMKLFFHKMGYLNNNCPAQPFFFGFTLQSCLWLLLDSTK